MIRGGGILVDIMSIATLIGPELRKAAVSQIFSVLQAWVMCQSTSYTWYSYIEVYDYNDRNHNGKIDEFLAKDGGDLFEGETIEDLKSCYQWREVCGVFSHQDRKAGATWTPGGGYQSSEECPGYQAAYNAAVIVASAYMQGREVRHDELDGYMPEPQYGPLGSQPYNWVESWIRRLLLNFGLTDVKKIKADAGCICPPGGPMDPSCPYHNPE